MKPISQLLLNFLLNASWQIALVAAAASLCAWLLRGTALRYRHWLWVSALALSFALPLLTTSEVFSRATFINRSQPAAIEPRTIARDFAQLDSVKVSAPETRASIELGSNLAAALIAIYLAFFLYRTSKLFQAWKKTRGMVRDAHPFDFSAGLEVIIERCERAIGVNQARILCSDSEPVPLTVGVRQPLVILPRQLLHDADVDMLTSALGHELVHVWRRDYLLNLIYELIFLPLAFHPAAALLIRRIRQTRELCCDELVAERLLDAKVYARSLVQLAGSAPRMRALASITTVGIADADILEVRVMSLLKKSRPIVRRQKLLLIAASILLALPCVAAASLGFHFDIVPGDGGVSSQEPKQQEQENQAKAERESKERQIKQEREDLELKQRIESETNPELRAQLKEALERRQTDRAKLQNKIAVAFMGEGYEMTLRDGQEEKEMKERAERDPQFRAELEARARHQEEEREAMSKRNAALAGLAKIPMDQAIQIALSQQPGKVLECSLVGEHWEGEGKLAKASLVLYHVVIVPAEGTATATVSGRDGQTYTVNLGSVHVLINAMDGSVFRTEKERVRDPRKEQP